MPAPARSPFQYALLRVVPRLERGECMNAGVVLYAPTLAYLGAQVGLDERRLTALSPDTDVEAVARQLDGLARIAAGEPDAGPIAELAQSARFGWLTSPSSTVIQPSPVHTGLCVDPARTLAGLFARLVA
jgi:hypothetical protein